MPNPAQNPQGACDHDTGRSERHYDRLSLFLGCLVAPAIYGAGAYFNYRKSGNWLSALGFPIDVQRLWIIGGFVALCVMAVLMLQNVHRLPPSRERTLLKRIGNLLLGFLFAWPFIYVMVASR